MSYILEALKKADADRERERSRVPDLHAQPDLLADRDRLRDRSGRGRWAWAAGLVLAAVGIAWWAMRPAPAPTQPDTVRALEPAASPLGPTATAPALPVVTAASRQAAASAAEGMAPPPPQTPAVIAVQIAAPAAPRATTAAAAKPAAAAPPLASLSPSAPAASAAAPRLPLLAELPAEIRNQLPVLNVGGSMYSTSASVRMVILSGQVFREGDSPAPGLTVVQIGPKSTVLAFRGQRFELKH